MQNPFLHAIQPFRNLGWKAGFDYLRQRRRLRRGRVKQPYVLLGSKYAAHPLRCRANTSDIGVFRQVFAQREYRCLDDLRTAGLILDCGANVGYSSAYFLTRFPQATVIAVEPDPANFAALEANLAPYQGRWRGVRSAVWSRPTALVLAEANSGAGCEWSRQVRPARAGETPTIRATDIGTLLHESGFPHISILKIDIEGAEEVLFASNYERWLGRVENLVIELHGPESVAIFKAAVAAEKFAISRCGELTVCRRT
jgi:FkbM family methyltransferase